MVASDAGRSAAGETGAAWSRMPSRRQGKARRAMRRVLRCMRVPQMARRCSALQPTASAQTDTHVHEASEWLMEPAPTLFNKSMCAQVAASRSRSSTFQVPPRSRLVTLTNEALVLKCSSKRVAHSYAIPLFTGESASGSDINTHACTKSSLVQPAIDSVHRLGPSTRSTDRSKRFGLICNSVHIETHKSRGV